jgi:hypothetical protein
VTDPLSAAGHIEVLIRQAEAWHRQHVAESRPIDAAACQIRLVALRDALRMVNYAERKK